jgi:hypothetical protein
MNKFEEKYAHIKLMPNQFEPFNGDTHLCEWVKDLATKHKMEYAIELGTCLGGTTIFLAEQFETVATAEINVDFAKIAHDRFAHYGVKNIELYVMDSRKALPEMLKTNKLCLVWLDSHWGSDNPLLDELAIIAASGIKPVLMIHDFKVPDHPELGFDSYGGQDYEWSWIEKSIEAIYGVDGYTKTYNSEAVGAMRGVVVIEPK